MQPRAAKKKLSMAAFKELRQVIRAPRAVAGVAPWEPGGASSRHEITVISEPNYVVDEQPTRGFHGTSWVKARV